MYRKSHENDFSKKLASKVMKDFCESTSLHGYSHLYLTDSIVSKIVWFLVILFTTSLGLFLFVKNTNDYFTARIVTNIETSSANLSVSTLNTNNNKDQIYLVPCFHWKFTKNFLPLACGVPICNNLQFESNRG